MTVTSSSGPTGTAHPHSSGIRVLVVGLGIGGLATAIECHRKGHTVTAMDKNPVHRSTKGDLLGISTNAARIISKWGDGLIHEQLYERSSAVSIEICDTTGKSIIPADMTGVQKNDGYWVLRSVLASTLYEHAQSLGIDLHVGPDAEVASYWETADESGVITVDQTRYTADCVICCDGINSKGRQLILADDPPFLPATEHAFRTSFSTEELLKDKDAGWLLNGAERADFGKVFKGPGLEIGFSTFENGRRIVLVAMYNGKFAEEKLGKLPESFDDVSQLMSDWPLKSTFDGVLKYVSSSNLIHHPLAMRPPLRTWISKGSRMIVIGDAAHAVLPILGQGACQAVEDAAILAITLELAGRSAVPLALQVAERIRKPRATVIQQASGISHRQWYDQDWESALQNPSAIKTARPAWILNHNCQPIAYEEYGKVVRAIQTGQEYVPPCLPTADEMGIAENSSISKRKDKPSFLD